MQQFRYQKYIKFQPLLMTSGKLSLSTFQSSILNLQRLSSSAKKIKNYPQFLHNHLESSTIRQFGVIPINTDIFCFLVNQHEMEFNCIAYHLINLAYQINTNNHNRLNRMQKQAQSKKSNIIPKQITNQEVACISQMKDKLNSKLGVNHDSYDIISISSDQVTGATRYYHLRGKPGNKEYTVTINHPSGEKNTPIITQSCAGLKAHQQGFWQQEVQD